MVVVRTVVFVAGMAMVVLALRSAVETVILPRSAQNTLARIVFRSTGSIAGRRRGERE